MCVNIHYPYMYKCIQLLICVSNNNPSKHNNFPSSQSLSFNNITFEQLCKHKQSPCVNAIF